MELAVEMWGPTRSRMISAVSVMSVNVAPNRGPRGSMPAAPGAAARGLRALDDPALDDPALDYSALGDSALGDFSLDDIKALNSP